MNKTFSELREKYPVFSFNGYSLKKEGSRIKIEYDFSFDGLVSFHPVTEIEISNLDLINDFNSDMGKDIIFSLGMVEAVSYWKSCCSPVFEVKCGYLDEKEIEWWKKLYFGGLGEFFYRNEIETDFNSFMTIKCTVSQTEKKYTEFNSRGYNLIPVGGGKDSDVTISLLKEEKDNNFFFTVNDQPARTEGILAAGYDENRVVKTYRTIDKELLSLNAKGHLNGHTPFSAIVAFLSLYCAYLIGAENIILSNEASANEGNIKGVNVNHQYSKSYEFEQDFNKYNFERFGINVKYFSILRCFNELQIAKQFSGYKYYHHVFRSCNAGSKKNIWCCKCPKCLFVYIILSPFNKPDEVKKIFGTNMLNDENMKDYFDGLAGFSDVKPFECIGTIEEVSAAIEKAISLYENEKIELPLLFGYYKDKVGEISNEKADSLLKEFNEINNVPEKFGKYIKEMYGYVSKTD